MGIEVWEKGNQESNCSGMECGPRVPVLGVGLCCLETGGQVGDLAGDCTKGEKRCSALFGSVSVDWGAGGEKLRCGWELGRGERGWLGISVPWGL